MASSRPLFLQRDVELVEQADGVHLARRGGVVRHRLNRAEVLAIGLLAHYGERHAAEADLNACLGGRRGTPWMDRVLSRWATYLGDGPPRQFDRQWMTVVDERIWGMPTKQSAEAAPASLSWLVTLTCNRKCPYCYYKVLPWDGELAQSPADATFPMRLVTRMLDEIAQVGTADLFLTGGEPLLRPDLPEIIDQASARSIRAHVNTKFHVDSSLARKLATARVARVTFSLDAASSRLADGLTASRGFLREAIETIGALLRENVPLRINAVVSPINSTHIDKLVDLCVSMGVPALTLSPYMEPAHARGLPRDGRKPFESLAVLVARQRTRSKGKIGIEAGSGEAFEGGRVDCGDRLLCEVGIRSLDVLPDGRVTRCRYDPAASDLIIGDLSRQSLMDIWTGSALAAFNAPAKERFEGSACGSCGGRDSCTSRGRCVLGARLQFGRLYAPDAGCTRDS